MKKKKNRPKYRTAKCRPLVTTQFFDDGTGNYAPIWTVSPKSEMHGDITFESAAELKEFAEELTQWVSKNIKDK